MLSAPTLINVIKYGFLGLVFTGAGFLIKNTAVMTHYESAASEDIAYRAWTWKRNESLLLDKNSLNCLTHPSKPFCLMSSSRRVQLLRNTHSAPPEPHQHLPHPVYSMLEDFRNVTTSLNVTPILLEPSMLFCMLPTLQKYRLISGPFHTASLLHTSPDVVTIGVSEEDADTLSQEVSINKFLKSKLAFSTTRKWLDFSHERNNSDFFFTNFFYSRRNLTLHVVVFFQKQTYYWLPGLPAKDYPIQVDPFGTNSIYEKFKAVPLRFEDRRESGFYSPLGIEQFLLQTQQSQFRNCLKSSDVRESSPHPSLTSDQLNRRSSITIQELKSKLAQHMVTFWLWGDTLAGWYENCNLFQKTKQLNLAVHALAVSKLNLTDIFQDNEYIKLLKYYQWEDTLHKIVLDCHDLRIQIFITYEDTNSIWYYEMSSSQQLTKISHLKFQLCSSSVLGQLVHVPCDKKLEKE